MQSGQAHLCIDGPTLPSRERRRPCPRRLDQGPRRRQQKLSFNRRRLAARPLRRAAAGNRAERVFDPLVTHCCVTKR